MTMTRIAAAATAAAATAPTPHDTTHQDPLSLLHLWAAAIGQDQVAKGKLHLDPRSVLVCPLCHTTPLFSFPKGRRHQDKPLVQVFVDDRVYLDIDRIRAAVSADLRESRKR